MNIGKDKLRPIKTPLMGFGGESVIAEGAIQLLVMIGEALDQVTSIVNCLVVDCPYIYNMIVGRPFFSSIKVIIATYALVVKFSIRNSGHS